MAVPVSKVKAEKEKPPTGPKVHVTPGVIPPPPPPPPGSQSSPAQPKAGAGNFKSKVKVKPNGNDFTEEDIDIVTSLTNRLAKMNLYSPDAEGDESEPDDEKWKP